MSKKTVKAAEDTESEKDFNQSALNKVEEKFAEQNDVPKESTDMSVSKESYHALVIALEDRNGALPSGDLLVEAAKIIEVNNEEKGKLKVLLIDAGWSGVGSVIEAARDYIVAANAELQVLDTTLIANAIKNPDSEIHPIEAVVRFINNPQNWRTPSVDEVIPSGRTLAEGTKLNIAGETVVLAQDAVVNYSDEGNEQKFVSLCVHSENFDVNRKGVKFRYDGLGRRMPLEEQVDDPNQLNDFISSLTETEAASFGATASEIWGKLKSKEEAEKEAEKEAEEAAKAAKAAEAEKE